MTRGWKAFWFTEIALLMLLGYQTATNTAALVGVLFGVLALWLGIRGKFWRTFWLTVGTILVVVAVFVNPTVWVMLFLAVLAFWRATASANRPWAKKEFVAVTTQEAHAKSGRQTRHAWFGDATIGRTAFEWDDINLTLAAGDTIVDLGNTLLPPGDSTIVIRKGFGKTRVLVPIGVGYVIDHSALIGSAVVDGTPIELHNQRVKQFSADYDAAARRIHIITNALVGDLEVVAV